MENRYFSVMIHNWFILAFEYVFGTFTDKSI